MTDRGSRLNLWRAVLKYFVYHQQSHGQQPTWPRLLSVSWVVNCMTWKVPLLEILETGVCNVRRSSEFVIGNEMLTFWKVIPSKGIRVWLVCLTPISSCHISLFLFLPVYKMKLCPRSVHCLWGSPAWRQCWVEPALGFFCLRWAQSPWDSALQETGCFLVLLKNFQSKFDFHPGPRLFLGLWAR